MHRLMKRSPLLLITNVLLMILTLAFAAINSPVRAQTSTGGGWLTFGAGDVQDLP